jgi:hypothetical protein
MPAAEHQLRGRHEHRLADVRGIERRHLAREAEIVDRIAARIRLLDGADIEGDGTESGDPCARVGLQLEQPRGMLDPMRSRGQLARDRCRGKPHRGAAFQHDFPIDPQHSGIVRAKK